MKASSSWRAAPFVVVDLETTGLDPKRDEVVSFAAFPVEEGRIAAAGVVHGLVRPRNPPAPASVEIHGLRASDLAAAPPAPAALEPLARALDGRIPVVHHAWVERSFLGALGMRLPRRMVDTAQLWRLLCVQRGEGDPGAGTLAQIARGLGMPLHRPHVAEGDALTTAQLFLALATHLEGHGLGSVRDLTGAERQVQAFGLWHPPGPVSRG